MTRRSIRRFTDEAVTEAELDTVLRAAMAAPSASNEQSWRFVVVRDRDVLTRLSEATTFAGALAGAPVGVVVCAGPAGVALPRVLRDRLLGRDRERTARVACHRTRRRVDRRAPGADVRARGAAGDPSAEAGRPDVDGRPRASRREQAGGRPLRPGEGASGDLVALDAEQGVLLRRWWRMWWRRWWRRWWAACGGTLRMWWHARTSQSSRALWRRLTPLWSGRVAENRTPCCAARFVIATGSSIPGHA